MALYVPTPTYQMDLGTAQQVGLPERASLRPENCQFSGLEGRVPGQQVLRIGGEGMEAKNWGFLAWRPFLVFIVGQTNSGPHVGVRAPFSFAQTGFGDSFPPPNPCL